MGYRHHLLRAELVAVACLVAYGLALAALMQLGAAVASPAPQSFEEAARAFVLVLWFSILPTVFLFAPVYALLHAKGWSNMAASILLGIAASAILVVLFRNGPMALYALPSGAVVGAGTHLVMKWWAGRGARPPVAT